MNNISKLDLNKSYSYADYLTWRFQERLELIKGKIFKMSPAPRVRHQAISMYVGNQLYNFLSGKDCKVFTAPFDVRLTKKNVKNELVKTVVQPDICVICDPDKLDELGCVGAPDIVVEILSPGNNTKELKNKYDVYEENGIQEYWIIHPEEKTFLAYTLNAAGKYIPSALKTIGDEIITPVLPGFVLNLEKVFDY
ncbi:Uma2 family endonuclease [Niabella ginsengisoli]|uniref:Uma2 family endonuclease n=1 Tax=Niabella ginsengisoli TaxID=522298 RepID=A0ABS9SLA6_9BACT|nr:Uma2 family endonuclease [Niabella ginsengisoli]MCH5599148.1 Uma2 family endonuclease [Niabella ginsengisoli]